MRAVEHWGTPGNLQRRSDSWRLSDLINEIRHDVRVSWRGSIAKYSLQDVVQWYHVHFAQRDAFKAVHQLHWHSLAEDTMFLQVDYAERHCLPFGKKGPSHAYYADCVLGCTVLGVILWDSKTRWSKTFLSEVNETTGAFAIACIRHAMHAIGDLFCATSAS